MTDLFSTVPATGQSDAGTGAISTPHDTHGKPNMAERDSSILRSLEIDEEFRAFATIAPLTTDERKKLTANTLSFEGFDITNKKYLTLRPSSLGQPWWFLELQHIEGMYEDYSKKPLRADMMKYLPFLQPPAHFRLQPRHCDPIVRPWQIAERKHKAPISRDIYIIQAVIGGPVKIGVSVYPPARLEQLQVGCPFPLRIIKSFPATKTVTEKGLHARFAAYRLHGEWFQEDILALLEKEGVEL